MRSTPMRSALLFPLAVVAALLLLGSFYVVNEGKTAMVLNLGRVVRSEGPGLHFKWPLVESVRIFDRRLQVIPAEPERYLTSERKDVSIDFFAVGMIEDARDFYVSTNGGDEQKAVELLAPIITDSLRNEINSRTLSQIVSGNRSDVIGKQLETINQGAAELGIRIVDLRIKQADLPTGSKVITDVYRRMSAQRQQVASRLRAEGEEQAQTIRARADRDRAVILAEAERDAQKLRGEGDAEAARIYGQAAGADPGFFAFQRSLDAYRKSFDQGNGVIVLERDDPFLQYLRSDR